MKEADLKQKKLVKNPVQDNLDQVNLTILLVVSWKISANKNIWAWEKSIEECLRDGSSVEVVSGRQIPISLDNIRAFIGKTVLLLGQNSNFITYFINYNILVAPNCPAPQSKEILRK